MRGEEHSRPESSGGGRRPMAMEPLPLGFSITMDPSLASLWWTQVPPQPLQDLHCYHSVEEVKQSLEAATAEMQAASDEVRRKEKDIAALVDLSRRTAQERDLLREQHHLLLTSSSCGDSGRSPLPSSSYPVAIHGSALFKPFVVPSSTATVVPEDMSKAAALDVPSFAAVVAGKDSSTAAALEVPRFAAVSGEDKSTVAALEVSRFAAVAGEDKSKLAAFELLAAKRALPQKGRMVQAVMEAGPLLQNLLVASPLPRWRNPPSSQALTNAMISAPAPSGSGATMCLPWSTR